MPGQQPVQRKLAAIFATNRRRTGERGRNAVSFSDRRVLKLGRRGFFG